MEQNPKLRISPPRPRTLIRTIILFVVVCIVYGVVKCMHRGEKGIYLTCMTSISCGRCSPRGHVEFPSVEKETGGGHFFLFHFLSFFGGLRVGPTSSHPPVPTEH